MSSILPVLAQVVPLPKRTRKNVRQSKGGCFTCRSRRKKCDEEKPHCRRCLKANFTCEGYPAPTSSGTWRQASLSGNETDGEGLSLQLCHAPGNPRCTRLYTLGLRLLFQEAAPSGSSVGSRFWAVEVPQVSSVNDSVYMAVTSFGAMYEATTLESGSTESLDYVRALSHYQQALSKLQSEIDICSDDLLPIFAASVLPAAVETLRGQLPNALLHINGAFAYLQQKTLTRSTFLHGSKVSLRPCQIELKDFASTRFAQLYAVARVLDVQVASFALDTPLRLPPVALQPAGQIYLGEGDGHSSELLDSQVMSVIHSCLHFANTAASFKYVAKNSVPSDITMQQCRLIAEASQWLQILRQRFVRTSDKALLVLKAHCLSTVIYLSTILNPYERAYDTFHTLFQEITTAAGAFLTQQSIKNALASPQHRFRLLVSLAQPLFLTATKCRNRIIRQEAISLLRLTGREGPWHSRIHAEVAQRVLEIEERPFDGSLATFSTVISHGTANSISERARVCGCGVERGSEMTACPQIISISVSRCVDVDQMVNDTSTSWKDRRNWDIWSEQISLKP